MLRMGIESLQAAITRAGSPVELMRGSTARPHVFPVAPEFTNWRSEQQAWRATCALLDQSHHMTDLFLSGPDALRLLGDFGVNSFAGFAPGKAKQYVAVNAGGYFIGDAILFYLEDDLLDLLFSPDWAERFRLAYEAETGRRTDPWWDLLALAAYRDSWRRFIPIQVGGRVQVDTGGMTARVEDLIASVLGRL